MTNLGNKYLFIKSLPKTEYLVMLVISYLSIFSKQNKHGIVYYLKIKLVFIRL